MKVLEFNGFYGDPVFIIADKITGFSVCATDKSKVFVATGPDGADGGENGWIVGNTIEEVKMIIEGA